MKLLILKRKADGVVSIGDIVVHVDIERTSVVVVVVVATNPAKAVLTLLLNFIFFELMNQYFKFLIFSLIHLFFFLPFCIACFQT